jgi:hypothetical protein
MITIQTTCDDADLEEAVDQDIKKFDAYFQSLPNDPLVKVETAIIKTYLHWKLKGEKNNGSQASR